VVDGRTHDGVLMAERIDVLLAAPAKNDPRRAGAAAAVRRQGTHRVGRRGAQSFVVRGTTAFYDTTRLRPR
jgi:hypothetical protein